MTPDEMSAKITFLKNLVEEIRSGQTNDLRVPPEEAIAELEAKITEGEQLLRDYAASAGARN